jgi:plasmid stability protein
MQRKEGITFMTLIELSDEQAAKLKAKAAAHGLTLEAWFEELADEATGARRQIQVSTAAPRRHIADVIIERMRKVPPEIMDAMPADGASQHDHYLYASPKRDQ